MKYGEALGNWFFIVFFIAALALVCSVSIQFYLLLIQDPFVIFAAVTILSIVFLPPLVIMGVYNWLIKNQKVKKYDTDY